MTYIKESKNRIYFFIKIIFKLFKVELTAFKIKLLFYIF